MSDWQAFVSPDGGEYYYNNATGESTWDKPEELKDATEKDVGEWCWIPEPAEGFIVGQILHQYNDGAATVRTPEGREVQVSIPKGSELVPLKLSQLKKLTDDLVKLEQIKDPFIVHNLRERCKTDNIYTYVGDILISVNPFEQLPLYTSTIMEKYLKENHDHLPPHVFAIADQCYKNLLKKQDQSVIISGESGAGKTEATKLILQYLAEVAGSAGGVEQQVLLANPILESFGNAKTLRNNNSSRFGKWMEIHFSGRSKIIGCKIVSYLLEKSRVTIQANNERNFHIFYQILAGADDALRAELYLDDPENFSYLNQSGCIHIDGTDDAEDFRENMQAMETLNFTPDEKKSLLRVCAAILHLGNIVFIPDADGTGSIVQNTDELDIAAHLLGVRADMLRENFVSRRFQSKGRSSAYCVPLDPPKAKDGRDSLCQNLYGLMFDWIVLKINGVLSKLCGSERTTIIGVLDIFGFEIFEKNSFEQLCINFANEKLQQHFNAHTFKLEEEVYKAEQIKFTHVEFIDNQVVLDLIEKKPAGLLCLLDEEIIMPKASDFTFIQKLDQKHGGKQNPRYKQNLRAKNKFTVVHYAGDVEYEVDGFLDKNKDTLYEGLLELMSISEVGFIAMIFGEALKACSDDGGGGGGAGRGGGRGAGGRGAGGRGGGAAGGGGASGGSKSRKISLGGQFKDQLNKLMDTLNTTNPHYIRCVKPNEFKKPCKQSFNGMNVLRQLRYAGVFEAVTIRQTGFPFRNTHEDFYKRYKAVIREDNIDTAKKDWKRYCQLILDKMQKSKDVAICQIGQTKVLYRAIQHRDFELLRNVALEKAVIVVQAHNRGWRARRLYRRMAEIRNILRAAMKARQLQGLIDAILNHDNEADFTLVPEYDNAVKLRDLVKEELRITAVVKDVLAELGGNKDPPQGTLDKLTAVVQAAQKINFHTPDVDNATSLFEEITSRIQTRKDLKAGVANSDEALLNKAVAEAERLGFSPNDALLTEGQNELARIEQEKVILASMRVALSLPAQGPADLSYSTPHLNQLIQISPEGEVVLYEGAWEELEDCVTQAHNFGVKTAEGKKLLESSTLVLHLRSAIGQDDWDQVEKLLLDNKLGDSPSLIKTVEMRAAHDQLILKAKKAEVQDALEAAAAIFDANALQLSVDKGFALRMEVDSYQQLVDAIVATQQALYDGLQAIEEEALTYAIGLADQIYYNLEDYHQAVQLRDTLKSLTEEIDFTLNLMPDKEALEELYNRAKDVGLHTAPFDELGGYLQLDEEGLAKVQLKSALRRNDKERVIQLNIRLKEIFFKLFGSSFVFTQCSKFKTPSEYTKGVIFKKEKVRDNMMKWSKHPVHTCITRMNPLYGKEAILVNKNLLGWMGDKAMSFPSMLAREILEKGIQIPDVRDEIYVQIIKQVTDNPNPQSTEKGWKLMNMCLHCFPPSREFENYLEIYFRNKDGSSNNMYRKQLHQIVWSGPVAVPPSPEQISSEF